VAALHNLERFDAGGTKISDDGIMHLKALTSLKELHCWKTGVTRVGAMELKKELPNLKVISLSVDGEYVALDFDKVDNENTDTREGRECPGQRERSPGATSESK